MATTRAITITDEYGATLTATTDKSGDHPAAVLFTGAGVYVEGCSDLDDLIEFLTLARGQLTNPNAARANR